MRRRRTLLLTGGLAAALVLSTWAARAGRDRGAAQVDPTVAELLSGINFVPTQGMLDRAMGANAPAELIAIASGSDVDRRDPGIRIRAYRALALYPSPATEAALREALRTYAAATSDVRTVYLRAAMGSLAKVAQEGAVEAIAELLSHPVLDVRAAAADALGETRSADAACVLGAQLAVESSFQVRVAIEHALQRVGTCPTAFRAPSTP